jgi:hypothetical protein
MLELRIVPTENEWYNLHFVFSPRGGISGLPQDCSLGRIRLEHKQELIDGGGFGGTIADSSMTLEALAAPPNEFLLLEAAHKLLEVPDLQLPDLRPNLNLWPEQGVRVKIVNRNDSPNPNESGNYNVFLNEKLVGSIPDFDKTRGRIELLKASLELAIKYQADR